MAGNRLISGRDLATLYNGYKKDHGEREGRVKFRQHLSEALEAKHLHPRDFSIRELFEAVVPDGNSMIRQWQNEKGGFGAELLEAAPGASAVGYSDFSNITGQIFFTMVKEKYESEEFVFGKAITSKPSTIQDIERIPGITRIGDQALVIPEGGEYPRLGVGEDYQEVAAKKKRGAILEVTKEAVAGDKTGELLDRCGELGYFLGLNDEKRIIDAIIDENEGAASAHQGGHRYTWRGTAYATYQTSSPWINSKTSTALTNASSLNTLWLLMAAITDPFTGEPIMVNPDTLIVAPDLLFTASRIVSATEYRSTDPGYATSANPAQTVGPNPISHIIGGGLKVMSSRLLKSRLATDTNWFLGSPKKAVCRFYNWDVTTAQRSTNTDAEFERDIVMQFKASLKDAVSVIEPRLMAKSAA